MILVINNGAYEHEIIHYMKFQQLQQCKMGKLDTHVHLEIKKANTCRRM